MEPSYLRTFLKRENKANRRAIPLETPAIRVITSSDCVERVSIGAHTNGVVFLTLLQRQDDGVFKPLKCWRRELPMQNLMNIVSGKARVYLQARADQRAKETKLKAYKQ